VLVAKEGWNLGLIDHRQIVLAGPADIPAREDEHRRRGDLGLQLFREPLAEVMGALLRLFDSKIFGTPGILKSTTVERDLMAARLFAFSACLRLDGEEPTLPYHNVIDVEGLGTGIVVKRNIVEDGPSLSHELVEFFADRALPEKAEIVVAAKTGLFLQTDREVDHCREGESNNDGAYLPRVGQQGVDSDREQRSCRKKPQRGVQDLAVDSFNAEPERFTRRAQVTLGQRELIATAGTPLSHMKQGKQQKESNARKADSNEKISGIHWAKFVALTPNSVESRRPSFPSLPFVHHCSI